MTSFSHRYHALVGLLELSCLHSCEVEPNSHVGSSLELVVDSTAELLSLHKRVLKYADRSTAEVGQ